MAAQHVESWTASILLLQQVLAGLNNGDHERLGGSTGPLLEEAQEVASCRDESAQGPLDILEFDLQGIPDPPVTHEICESKDDEERPSTADMKQDDLVSTCDGSRRDPESRCDFWEGSELGSPSSSDRPQSERRERPHELISRPVKPLCEEECRENEDGAAGTMPPVPSAPASPCQVGEDEQSDARRMRREAEKLVSDIEAKAHEVLREQEEEEANAIRIRREAERLVDELEAKAKKALREKHEEQLSATRIRQEAERIVDRVQERAQEAAKEQQERSNATSLRKQAAKLVDEVEAETRKALREQRERSQSRQEGRVEAKEPSTAAADPDPATTKLRVEAEKLEAEIRATFTEQQKKDAADRAEATSRALDAQFEALQESEKDRAEAFQALEATREVVRQGDLAYAKAELSETARREAEERAKAQEKEIQDARRRMMQEQALQKTESERREALRALQATRQVARNSNDDAKAKWEQMKAQAAEAEREVKEAANKWNRQAEEKAAQAQVGQVAETEIRSEERKVQKVQPDVKDELERAQAEADNLLASAQKAKALAEEEHECTQQLQLEAKRAEAKAKAAQMEALKCREKLRMSQKEADDAERARCEAVLQKVRWRVEARRLEVEEELFSQATLDAERPDQMDAFGAFPPVINHARNNLDFALRRVRNKMEAHGLRRVPQSEKSAMEEPQVQKPETFDQMVQRMRGTWDQRLKVLEGQGRTPGSQRPRY